MIKQPAKQFYINKLLNNKFLKLIKFFDLDTYFTFENLKAKKEILTGFVNANYMLSIVLFISLYIVSVAFMIPIATVLTFIRRIFIWLYFWSVICKYRSYHRSYSGIFIFQIYNRSKSTRKIRQTITQV